MEYIKEKENSNTANDNKPSFVAVRNYSIEITENVRHVKDFKKQYGGQRSDSAIWTTPNKGWEKQD